MSETKKLNLYQKLLEIQKKIIGLKKDSKGNNYEFVSGSKVLEYVKPLMNDYGIILKQEIISIENARQDYTLKNGTIKSEILSKVMMRFTWVDCETGDKDENLFGSNGQNDWDKGVGSALTYGERYFLLKFFHIATDEDDIDARKELDIKMINETQKQTLIKFASMTDIFSEEGIKGILSLASKSTITEEETQKAIDKYQEYITSKTK